jgi:hypothetical protein
VLNVVLLYALEGTEFRRCHRLDDESLVMTEEEERARLSRALSALEDLSEVVNRVQGFLDRCHVQVV